MSKGGFPVQPYFVLGGFIPEGSKGFPAEPDYAASTAVVVTFLIDNYDRKSIDPNDIERLKKAEAWELAFVEFMRRWTANPENTAHMDVAFYSERSIEDELDRETSGDILTIALSYLIMFFYITFSLGHVSRFSTFLVSGRGSYS